MTTVNYYPANGWGRRMWQGQSFDIDTIRRDLFWVARRTVFDQVRVFLHTSAWNEPDATSCFNFGGHGPTAAQLDRLAQVATAARNAGLLLHLSLFDLFGNYDLIDDSRAWLRAVATAVPASAVGVVEVQNETPWAARPETAPWARAVIAEARTAWPGIPVCVSAKEDPTVDLAAAVTALKDLPDWYEWHCYADAYRTPALLASALAVTAGRLRIGEYGYPSQSQYPTGQADYLARVAAYWQQAKPGARPPAPFMLYDPAPGQGPTGAGATYGLLTTDGTPKPAAAPFLRP